MTASSSGRISAPRHPQARAPSWPLPGAELYEGDPVPAVRERYAEVRDLTASRPAAPPR